MTYEVLSAADVRTLIAGVSYASGQYRACAINSSGLAVLPSAGGRIAGIVQNKPASGAAARVAKSGISKMEASAAIAAGAKVMVAADGRGLTATSTNMVIGTALEAAGAAGVYFPIELGDGGAVL